MTELQFKIQEEMLQDAHIVVDPQRGSVLSLDGDADWVDCGNHIAFNTAQEITVSTWVKVNSFDKSWQAVVNKGKAAMRIQRSISDDSLEFACEGTEVMGVAYGGIHGSISVNDGKWHHVVGTYNGDRLSLYIDGVLDTSKEASGLIFVNNHPVLIGCNDTKREWNGLIDDVRIYNYGLGL